MSEYDFNDLLAEWLDIIGGHGSYLRDGDGKFDWIDFCTWASEDFDTFVKEKMKNNKGHPRQLKAEYYQELNVKYVKIFRKIRDMLLKLELDSGWAPDKKEKS